MISVDEAHARLFAAAAPLPSEIVPLGEAVGRVLTEPVIANRTQPPDDLSAMDGYAGRAADFAAGARVAGESAAGARHEGALAPGEAVRIFTGAAIPAGADTILIQENAAVADGVVRATEAPTPGAHIRRRGLDFAAGARVLPAGLPLAPRHIALGAAAGSAWFTVARRPRVAFLATGNELVPPGEPVGRDQIVSSTTAALAAMAASVGAQTHDLGIAPDDADAIAARVREGIAAADVLVTTGGASVGDHDLLAPALERCGVTPTFWRVAVRPGKPLLFCAHPLVLGLPGNPVSGLVCARLFLLPLLLALQGAGAPTPQTRAARLGADVPANGPRRDHMRAVLRDGLVFPAPVQDSAMLSVMAQADVLLVRQPHAEAATAGDACEIMEL